MLDIEFLRQEIKNSVDACDDEECLKSICDPAIFSDNEYTYAFALFHHHRIDDS